MMSSDPDLKNGFQCLLYSKSLNGCKWDKAPNPTESMDPQVFGTWDSCQRVHAIFLGSSNQGVLKKVQGVQEIAAIHA